MHSINVNVLRIGPGWDFRKAVLKSADLSVPVASLFSQLLNETESWLNDLLKNCPGVHNDLLVSTLLQDHRLLSTHPCLIEAIQYVNRCLHRSDSAVNIRQQNSLTERDFSLDRGLSRRPPCLWRVVRRLVPVVVGVSLNVAKDNIKMLITCYPHHHRYHHHQRWGLSLTVLIATAHSPHASAWSVTCESIVQTAEPEPEAPTHSRDCRLHCPHCLRAFTRHMALFGHMRIHDSGMHCNADNTDTSCTLSAPAILTTTATLHYHD
ncbi:unnamed protein product [Schistocephalus solidus]|uniref:C2H2-type domain-containing protein n=1 Tax=Schistocephalus solidus TaxID=70667 RepID=A0A183TH41_SCHSO|nr:unnamed protein product [Schistocephalus solidus]